MGLPGVGKSSILNVMKERHPSINLINYGDLLFSAARLQFNLRDRDKIVDLPMEAHLKIQKEAIKLIKGGKNTILDTHAVLKKPSGFLPGLAPDILSKPEIEGFVFIDAPTKDIMERRAGDPARTRPGLSAEELNEIRSHSFSKIKMYSASTGKPVFILINRKGKIDDTVEEFEHIIASLNWD